MAQFMALIRCRLELHSSQAIYFMVNDRALASLSATVGEVYETDADADGFLYITYASQNAFGF